MTRRQFLNCYTLSWDHRSMVPVPYNTRSITPLGICYFSTVFLDMVESANAERCDYRKISTRYSLTGIFIVITPLLLYNTLLGGQWQGVCYFANFAFPACDTVEFPPLPLGPACHSLPSVYRLCTDSDISYYWRLPWERQCGSFRLVEGLCCSCRVLWQWFELIRSYFHGAQSEALTPKWHMLWNSHFSAVDVILFMCGTFIEMVSDHTMDLLRHLSRCRSYTMLIAWVGNVNNISQPPSSYTYVWYV